MRNIIAFTTVASLAILVGCSSSGDGGTATLAAVAPEVVAEESETPNPQVEQPVGVSENIAALISEEEAAGSTVFSSLLEGVTGSFLAREVAIDDETLTALIDGEEFTFNRNRFDDVLVSEDNTVGILRITETEQGRASRVSGVFLVGNGIDRLEQTDIDSISNFGFVLSQDAGGANAIRVTPVDDLPAQATYSGRFFSISQNTIVEATQEFDERNPTGDDFIFEDRFDATATFGQTNTLEGSVFDEGNRVAEINADITGNTFAGTVNGLDDESSATLNGGFFGVNGQEILGSGSGVLNGEQSAIAIEGSRTDNVPIN